MDYSVIDKYIDELLAKSTPDKPIWNIEKIMQGIKSKWNYIDGCMIKAILEMYSITKNKKYFDFADAFIDYRVYDDGTIKANKGYLGKVEITNEGLAVVDGKITIYKKEYEISDPQPNAENFTEENYYIYSEESKEYKPATEFV